MSISYSGWRHVLSLASGRKALISGLAVASVVSGLTEAGILALVAHIASTMIVGDQQTVVSFGPWSLHLELSSSLFLAMGLASVRLLLQVLVAWLPAQVSADVQRDYRKRLLRSFVDTSWSVQAEAPDGQLQDLMTGQIDQAANAVLNLATLVASAIVFGTLFTSALIISVPAALAVLGVSALLFAALLPLARWGRRVGASLSDSNVRHAIGVSETAYLAEEMHVFGIGARMRRRVENVIDEARDAYLAYVFSNRLVRAGYQGLVLLLLVLGLAGLYWFDKENLASLGAVVLILVRAAAYGQELQGAYHSINQSFPYLERLEEAIRHFRVRRPMSGSSTIGQLQRVAFREVSYSYRAGIDVLKGISFDVEAGEAIGIIGPSGAGKSTLVQIILRLREPDAGTYEINGRPVPDLERTEWAERVSYVPQEPHLLRATVRENVRFLRDLKDEEVERACRLAGIHEEIEAWNGGYDRVVGPRGDGLSGGQRQRIVVARALAGQPDILVLDEPTSALDPRSEAAVQNSLAELRGDVTIFVVAHRMTTLAVCDRVMVVVAGALEAIGSPQDLSENSLYYRRAVDLLMPTDVMSEGPDIAR